MVCLQRGYNHEQCNVISKTCPPARQQYFNRNASSSLWTHLLGQLYEIMFVTLLRYLMIASRPLNWPSEARPQWVIRQWRVKRLARWGEASTGYHWIIETWDVYNLRLNLPGLNLIYDNKRIGPDCLGMPFLCDKHSHIVRSVWFVFQPQSVIPLESVLKLVNFFIACAMTRPNKSVLSKQGTPLIVVCCYAIL